MMLRLATILTLLLVPAMAHAHAVGVDCKLRGGRLEIEAFYEDDSPAIKAKVQVVNAADEVIATAVTDAKGQCTLDAPPPGNYEVRVDAGAGHRARKAVEVPTPSQEVAVTGPTRAEFTSFPWLKVLLGVSAIGALAGAYLIAGMVRKEPRTK